MFRRTCLLALLAGCYQAAPSLPPADAPSVAAPDPSAPRLRRLSPREVCNAYADLLGEPIAPTEFLAESAVMGFDNGSALSMMQTDQAARFEAVAWAAAERVTTRREPKVFAKCESNCKDLLVDVLARRAYRRPVTPAEATRLSKLYDDTARDAGSVIAEQATIAAIFQSPSFIYREELGAMTPSGVVRLTPWEVASELSFFIAGTTPDDVLLAAAATGELDQAPARRREATRLLQTPAARKLWRTFLRQWLALEDLPRVTKVPPYTLAPGLLNAMNEEIDQLFDHVLWRSTGSLDELFATDVGYPGVALASMYGVPDVVDSTQPAPLDAATRGGVLTRAGWLSVHSAPHDSAPIARGVFVLSALLCRPPTAPPPGTTRVAAASEATKTTRQRFALHTQEPRCQSCHQSIDGVGFGFEQFDPIGQYRLVEGGENVDSSGSVELGGKNVAFTGVTELSNALRASDAFRACFVKQMFRFAMGAPETPSTLPALVETAGAWTIDQRIDALAIAMVESDAFVVRKNVEAKK